MSCHSSGTLQRGSFGGFTLIELMMVVVIIGVLASIAVPAMKGLGQANRSAAAHRQILDDIALARLRAINDRTKVYMVFAPPTILGAFQSAANGSPQKRELTNLLESAFSSYALVASRTVGDQPGRPRPRYISEWRTLPEGYVFAPYKLAAGSLNPTTDPYEAPLKLSPPLPFPDARSAAALWQMPSIGFNSQGQLIGQRDEVITLAKGSALVNRRPNGEVTMDVPDVELNPPVKAGAKAVTQTNTYQFVRINWLTGRAKVEIPDF